MHKSSSLMGRPFSSQVPLLPFLPVASLFINVYLMMQLDRGTWMRFAIWMVIGTWTFLATDTASSVFSVSVFKRGWSCCCFFIQHCFNYVFAGFLIYFSYGIRNSSEADLNRSSTPACTIKGEPMVTEKAAFLRNSQNPDDDLEA